MSAVEDLREALLGKTPEEALSLIRRTRAYRSFDYFVQEYFEEYTRYAPAKCHADFISIVERIMERGGGSREAIAAPRGSAKTTFFTVMLPLWAICTGRKHFIVIVSDTEDQAKDQLKKIRDELENNAKLREDFGDLVGDPWGAIEIVTKTNIKVIALGSKQKIRGRGHGSWRPDLICIDDYENDKNSQSVVQRDELAQLIAEAVNYAGDNYTDILMVGTILHQESVLAKKLAHPLWNSRIFRSVITWATRRDLWVAWESLLINLADPDRLQTARAFFEQRQEEMLAGTDVLWPEKEDYYALMVQVVENPAAFQKERQNNPQASSECPFRPEDIVYYDGIDEPISAVHGFADPSMGESESSDYSAIVIIAVGKETGARYLLVADIRRRSPDEIIADIVAYYRRYRFTKFGGEQNVMQKYWLTHLQAAVREAGFSPIPEGINHTGNKKTRIKSLQPAVKNGFLRFPRLGVELLMQQLIYFPLTSHDDGPDALQACYEQSEAAGTFVFFSL